MIEIFVLIFLCKGNAAKATERGRSGGAAVAYTLLLWIGLELVGLLIGLSAEMETGAYVLAIIFAIVGGIISWAISKRGEPIIETTQSTQTTQTTQTTEATETTQTTETPQNE